MLVKGLRIDSEEVEGGLCVGGSNGRLCSSEKERGTFWRDYIEWITNKENDWDHNVEVDAVEGQVAFVSRGDGTGIKQCNTGNAPGHSEVLFELIVASRDVGIHVMAEICQRVIDRFVMPVERALSLVVLIFK